MRTRRIVLLIFILFTFVASLYGIRQWWVEHTSRVSSNSSLSCGVLSVYFLNVSHGDATLIVTPSNKTILIDGGSPSTSRELVTELERRNISHIDAVIATHFHEDHIGGLPDVFRRFSVGTVYSNGNCGNVSTSAQKNFERFRKAHNNVVVTRDMSLSLDPCLTESTLLVAYDRTRGCWKEENNNVILFRFAYSNVSVLIASDCEYLCEQELLAQNTTLRAHILRVAHHGAASSTSEEFLAAVSPRIAIISVGGNVSTQKRYSLPRVETLLRLAQYNVTLLRTDLHGTITLHIERTHVNVSHAAHPDFCSVWYGYDDRNRFIPVRSECS